MTGKVFAKSLPAPVASQMVSSKPVALSSGILPSKYATLILSSSPATISASTIQRTSLPSVIALADIDLDTYFDPSFTLSNINSDYLESLPDATSLSNKGTTSLGSDATTSQSSSLPTAPSNILVSPSENAGTRTGEDSDLTTIYTPPSSNLSPCSIFGVVLGSLALSSFIVLIVFLMRRKKKRSESIHCDLISHRSSSNFNEPSSPFRLKEQDKNHLEQETTRIQKVVRGLKYGLSGKKSKLFHSKKTRYGNVNLDRGNSQFFNNMTDHNQKHLSQVTHCFTGSRRSYAISWSAWHKQEIDGLGDSRKESLGAAEARSMAENPVKSGLEVPYESSQFIGTNDSNNQLCVKPDQVYLGGERLNYFKNEDDFSIYEVKSPYSTSFSESGSDNLAKAKLNLLIPKKLDIPSDFNKDNSDIDQRLSQIKVSQTVDQYRSDSCSPRSPDISLYPSTLSSTFDSNRDSLYSCDSSSANERDKKKRSDQFDLDSLSYMVLC